MTICSGGTRNRCGVYEDIDIRTYNNHSLIEIY